MESSARRRLTTSEGRKFAFTLAWGFAALGGILTWRDEPAVAKVFFGIAAIALGSGLVAPTHLGPALRAWTAFGVALSRITAPVFFTLIYMVVVTPMGLIRRTFGRSPLARDQSAPSFWVRRPPLDAPARRSAIERQF